MLERADAHDIEKVAVADGMRTMVRHGIERRECRNHHDRRSPARHEPELTWLSLHTRRSTKRGVLHTGEVTSTSRAVALETLSRRGLFPLSIDEGLTKNAGARRYSLIDLTRFRYRRRARAGARELLTITQSLASLLKAGLTIDRALQITANLGGRPASRLLAGQKKKKKKKKKKKICSVGEDPARP